MTLKTSVTTLVIFSCSLTPTLQFFPPHSPLLFPHVLFPSAKVRAWDLLFTTWQRRGHCSQTLPAPTATVSKITRNMCRVIMSVFDVHRGEEALSNFYEVGSQNCPWTYISSTLLRNLHLSTYVGFEAIKNMRVRFKFHASWCYLILKT